jgi:hypothetical protein
MATFAELQAALIAGGYVEGVPAGFSEGPAIDAETAEEARCESCGRIGLHYYAFHRRGERGYVALAVCPMCSWAEEF